MAIKVRRLAAEDDRSSFRSGNVDLDRFFQRYAGQNQFRHHIGTTYVAVDDKGTILGFATVAASELTTRSLPAPRRKRLPLYPIPVLRLARLAVDPAAQGLGSLLLRSVFLLAQKMSIDLGCAGVVVDAMPDAVPFYAKLGLITLDAVAGQLGDRPEPVPMFLEIQAIPKPTA